VHELQVHQLELKLQNDELRQAQIAMEKSRDRYADLYDFAPIGYLTLSREGVISEVNLTASGMLGIVRKKLLARRFSQFVVVSDRERWYLHFSSVLKHDQRQHCELEFLREDGSQFHAKVNSGKVAIPATLDEIEKLPDPSAERDAAYSVRIALTDTTEQIQAISAIQEAREFGESIVDTVPEPLVVLDSALKVVSVNRAFYKYFRVMPEETVGRQIHELGNRQWDIPELRESLTSILPHNRAIEGFKVERDFPGIGKRKLLLNARRIAGKTGELQAILLTINDVTALKQQSVSCVFGSGSSGLSSFRYFTSISFNEHQ
jgi:PAS domain S-box-containing protein